MSKQIAFRGHNKLGQEVIKILETLGGKNIHNAWGVFGDRIYTIDEKTDEIIDVSENRYSDYNLFTIEEFLEKYPYKIGDKVEYIKYDNEYPDVYTICNMKWTGNTIEYTLDSFGLTCLAKDIRLYKKPKRSKGLESLNVERYLKVWDETEHGLEVCVAEGYEMIEKDGQFYIVKQKTK